MIYQIPVHSHAHILRDGGAEPLIVMWFMLVFCIENAYNMRTTITKRGPKMADLLTDNTVISSVDGALKKRRMQFEFSTEAFQRLQEMKDKTGASSYASLVRDALRVYEYVAEQQRRGYEIALRKEGEPLKVVEFLTTK